MGDFSLIGGQASQLEFGYDASASTGQVVTASATTHTKGSWVEIVSAANNASGGKITIVISAEVSNNAAAEMLIDIGIGASGSEIAIINNIYHMQTQATSGQGMTRVFELQIGIPPGTRISARCQASAASATCVIIGRLGLSGFKGQSQLARVTTLGADTASSSGTQVTRGAVNTWSTAVSLGTLVNPVKGFFISAGRDPVSMTNSYLAMRVGLDSTDNQIIYNGHILLPSGSEETHNAVTTFIPIQIPAGEEIMISTSSTINNADNDYDFVFYGVD